MTIPKMARPMPVFFGLRRMSRTATIPAMSANGAGRHSTEIRPRYPAAMAQPERPTGNKYHSSGSSSSVEFEEIASGSSPGMPVYFLGWFMESRFCSIEPSINGP